MVRLVALYKRPADVAAFEKHYFEVHKPLAEKIPGVIEYKVGKVFGSPAGKSPWHLYAEMHFKDKESFKQGMNSAEAATATKDLMGFAKDLVEVMFIDETPSPVAR